jgi:hypothetical protein
VKVTEIRKYSNLYFKFLFCFFFILACSVSICLCHFFCTYYSLENRLRDDKKKRNRAMIRIYFHFYLFKSISSLALVHALCFSVINQQKKIQKKNKLDFCMCVSSFLCSVFYFVRAFYFYICYEVSSRQNCRSVYYWNFLCFIG